MLRSARVPPGMFPPTCSAVPFRPERNTRPDPPTPEILDPACAQRGRGSTASRWTPLPRPAQVRGPGQQRRKANGRQRVGAKRASVGLEESEGDQEAKATAGRRTEVERYAMRESKSRVRTAGGIRRRADDRRGHRASASINASGARSSWRSLCSSAHQSGPRLRLPAAA